MEPEQIEAYAAMLEDLAKRVRSREVNVIDVAQNQQFQKTFVDGKWVFVPTREFSLKVSYWVKSDS